MTIKDIIQQLRVTMDDAREQESHFESWLTQNEGICQAIDSLKILDTPPAAQRKPLTDDQLDEIAVIARRGNLHDLRIAIEAKLKERNNG
jgi:hypothetical protein